MTFCHIVFITTFFVILICNTLFFSLSRAQVVYSDAVHINEFLPDPIGDDATLEFIELYNNSAVDVDISGWKLDDIENSGSSEFLIPSGTVLPAGGYVSFYRPQTKISLNNDGDHVRFIRPDSIVQDDVVYTSTHEGKSYNRTGAGVYEEYASPTPNAVNTIPATPTPTPAPIIYSSDVHVSEFLPNPVGDDSELEFVELHNQSSVAIDLSGWIIDTGTTSRFSMPPGVSIEGGEFRAFFSSPYDISLSNSSDRIQLIRPDLVVQDDISYTTSKEGYSYDRSGAGIYEQSYTPTPSAANLITASPTPTPKPTPPPTPEVIAEDVVYDFSSLLVINEVLPNPKGPDENGEFIEIKSLDTKPINLFGWTLDDKAKGAAYHFSKDIVIGPKKIIAFYREKTNIALNNSAEIVQLIDPKGKIISIITYAPPIPEGQSFNRSSNSVFAWSETLTPQKENIISVQEKTTVTPMPQKARALVARKNPIVRASFVSRASAVLGAHTEKLSWPGTVSRTVVSSEYSSPPNTGKQHLFVLVGMTFAFLQLASGISYKEGIWHR